MKIKLNDVRLAFPVLFQPQTVNGQGSPAFSASFLFDSKHKAFTEIQQAIQKVATEKWKGQAASILTRLKTQDKLCLHSGDNKPNYEGFPGNFYVSARNAKKPLVLDKNPQTKLTEIDGVIYAGCYVNAVVEIWAQDNKFGQRVCASLGGVQFLRDGDSFGGGQPTSEDEFENLADHGEAGNDAADGTNLFAA